MFDDAFVLAALDPVIDDKRMLLLSLRAREETDVFDRAGWKIGCPGIIVAESVDTNNLPLEIVPKDLGGETYPFLTGDLFAFSPEIGNIIARTRPAAVKANFVTSRMDGGAFLGPGGNEAMFDAACALIELLRDNGYECYVSTWYRDDTKPDIRRLDSSAEWMKPRLKDSFPFNLIGLQDKDTGDRLLQFSEVFRVQGDRLTAIHDAFVAQLRDEAGQQHGKDQLRIQSQDEYIRMLEDAMLGLQPSDKIKLG